MVLVGPSGCGKTTALRMVAGLEEITDGEIRIDDTVVNDVDPRDRDVAMVFQNYALYPHMSVYENIAFGLKLQTDAEGGDRRARAARSARMLGLEELLDAQAARSSPAASASASRWAARSCASPQVFLMDEPLSNLDAQAARPDARRDRADPARARRDDDLRHARPGRGDDHGRPRRGHAPGRPAAGRTAAASSTSDPANLFVASFIGSPPMNLFQARLEQVDGSLSIHVGEQQAISILPRSQPQTPGSQRTRDGCSASAYGRRI